MTIRQALTQVEQVKPNAVPDEVLVQWLNEVDQTIFKELVKTHEYGTELVFGGYDRTDESGADSVVLLAPEPYSQLYVYYLCAQIDMRTTPTGCKSGCGCRREAGLRCGRSMTTGTGSARRILRAGGAGVCFCR